MDDRWIEGDKRRTNLFHRFLSLSIYKFRASQLPSWPSSPMDLYFPILPHHVSITPFPSTIYGHDGYHIRNKDRLLPPQLMDCFFFLKKWRGYFVGRGI